MSSLGITNNSLLNLLSSTMLGHDAHSGVADTGNEDFSSSLALRLATLQAQSANVLINSASTGNQESILGLLNGLRSEPTASVNALSQYGTTAVQVKSLSASGRNLALSDPESAYKMMTVINSDDVTYKAQFAELSDMKTALADMQRIGSSLGSITDSLDGATVTSRLQDFVGKYNDWINRFEGSVTSGGVLTGTQAAEVSLHELEQNIENPFNGARSGFRGLNDLGISIDENTHLATLNTNKLSAALASNKTGVVDTIREFGANYSKSAELLNSTGNFVPNRLANLNRAIEYIDSNRSALQSEFGTGAPAKTTQQISNALARYQQIMAA